MTSSQPPTPKKSTKEVEQAVMDGRAEDVARTLHMMESVYRETYFDESFEWGWENEGWYCVKAYRNRARELIAKFDERNSL